MGIHVCSCVYAGMPMHTRSCLACFTRSGSRALQEDQSNVQHAAGSGNLSSGRGLWPGAHRVSSKELRGALLPQLMFQGLEKEIGIRTERERCSHQQGGGD